YKEAALQKEFAGTDRRGNERYRYPHRPDLFVKSDITGAMLRYYVTLPDGRIAHPTELFPNYTQSNVEKEMARREAEEQNTRLWLDKYIREDRQFDTLEEATRFWNEQSANSVSPVHGQPTILPASERVPFYKDGKVALV